jgi:multidrug resistance efflux pump
VAICAGIALKIYILGAVLAAIYGFTVLWGTVVKFVTYLWKSPETAPVRGRAIALGAGVLAGVPLMVAAIPVCKPVTVRGVVTTIGERPVRAQTSGFLRQYEVVPGQLVETGRVLCVLDNAHVRATADGARAQYALLNLEAECELAQHPTTAAIVQRRAEHVRNIVREAQRDADNLSVRAPRAGEVIDCDANPRTGRFIQEGDAIATIASGDWIVRAPVTAQQIADARPFVGQKVRVRLLGQTSRQLAGTVTDVAEIGSAKIVPRSLTQLGGGTVAVAPDTMTAAEPYFEIIVRLDDACARLPHGATALVNLHARPQTIGTQLHRSALRFLNKLRS